MTGPVVKESRMEVWKEAAARTGPAIGELGPEGNFDDER
jgi:hypothetical protein